MVLHPSPEPYVNFAGMWFDRNRTILGFAAAWLVILPLFCLCGLTVLITHAVFCELRRWLTARSGDLESSAQGGADAAAARDVALRLTAD